MLAIFIVQTRIKPVKAYGKSFYDSGMKCLNQCDKRETLRLFVKSVYNDPGLADAYYQMGLLYGQEGDAAKQMALYEKAAAFPL